MKFTELNLNESLLEALDYMGFSEATPIQEKAIPLILDKKDVLACAQTGTGKTGAFVIPILHKLIGKQDTAINTLIVVPTRELAIQIEQQIQGLSYFISVGSMAIYGGGDGKSWNEQKEVLTEGTDIVVATPGKLLSHLKLGYVDFSKVDHLILDEADRMLDMGFIHDIRTIIKYLPEKHQTLMFSATMPKSIRQLANHIMNEPEEISLSISKPAEGVNQHAVMTHNEQKIETLVDLLKARENYDSIIVFSSSKSNVHNIKRGLQQHGIKSRSISSDLEQDEREEVLRQFRAKQTKIIVATDVLSRGIDIKDINLVVNFDVPNDAEDYVHRVGRTARANTKGEAITFINEKDIRKFQRIERLIESEIKKDNPPEPLGEGPKWIPAATRKKSFSPKNKKKKFYKKKPSQNKKSS